MNPYSNPPNNSHFSHNQQDPYPNYSFTSGYPHLPPQNPQQNPSHYIPPYPQQNQVYVPPNQYINTVPNPQQTDPNTLIHKIRELETQLKKGKCFSYSIWLWIVMVAMILASGWCTFVFLMRVFAYRMNPWYNLWNLGVILVFVWVGHFCHIELKAISKKSLINAKKGLGSMKVFALVYLLIFLFISYNLQYYRSFRDYGTYAAFFLGGYFIPMWINITGAKKVRKILKKRDDLLLQLEKQTIKVQ